VSVTKTVDEMTDEVSCYIRLNDQVFNFTVLSHEQIAIRNRSDIFSFEDSHLLRVQDKSPFTLTIGDPSDVLLLKGNKATEVLQALSNESLVRFRYYDWPERQQINTELKYPALGYAYSIAMEECGWNDIGVEGDIAPPTASIFETDDSFSYRFRGTSYPSFRYRDAEYYEMCQFNFDRWEIEYSEGNFLIQRSSIVQDEYLRVLDSNGEVAYETVIKRDDDLESVSFPELVQSMVLHSPKGHVVNERSGRLLTTSLLGFRQLYKKGEELCDMPSMEDILAY
jgi:hypothetical protein